jgi:hypothetical protein
MWASFQAVAGRCWTDHSNAPPEVQSNLWDDPREHRNLRVMVSVDDGGWRSFAPLSDDFIVAPDGTFIGE